MKEVFEKINFVKDAIGIKFFPKEDINPRNKCKELNLGDQND